MELRLRLTWIHSEGLGTNSGQGETGIRVPVQCYTECNSSVPGGGLELSSMITALTEGFSSFFSDFSFFFPFPFLLLAPLFLSA